MGRASTSIEKNAAERVGLTKIAKNGLSMTIIAYRSKTDVDIQFEDGYLAEHKNFANFVAGTVCNPQADARKKYMYIGQTAVAKNGMSMTVIDWRNARDVDIQFEDGTVVKHKAFGNFQKGYIAHPNQDKNTTTAKTKIAANAKERIGQQVVTKRGELTTLVAYRSATDVDIRFEDDGTIVRTSYNSFVNGLKTKKVVPKDSWDKTGEERYSCAGILCKVRAYRKATDIDVEFEDGTVVEHVSYGHFCAGLMHPEFRKSSLHNSWQIGEWIVTGLAYQRESGQGEFYCNNIATGESDIKTISEIIDEFKSLCDTQEVTA